jgi:WD40 repeat protein
VFDVESGRAIATLTGFTDYASDLAFTPDSARLASYHANGWIYLWDVVSGRQIKAIPAVPLPHRIKYLPDGRTLLTLQSGTLAVWLWNTASGSITHIYGPRPASQKDLKEHYLGSLPNWLAFADVSPDGKTIVTMTLMGEISLWDVKSGAETPVGERKPPEAKQMLQKASPSFSPDGKLLLYADAADHAIHVVDLATRQETASVPVGAVGTRKFFDLAPDGDTLAWVENTDGNVTVHLWSLSRQVSVGDVPVSTGTNKGQPVLAFTPDGRRVVIGGFAAMDNHNAVYVADVTG